MPLKTFLPFAVFAENMCYLRFTVVILDHSDDDRGLKSMRLKSQKSNFFKFSGKT